MKVLGSLGLVWLSVGAGSPSVNEGTSGVEPGAIYYGATGRYTRRRHRPCQKVHQGPGQNDAKGNLEVSAEVKYTGQ